MVMTDPIADLLTRIRNATRMGHKKLVLGHSKFKEAIVKLLVDEGYLAEYSVEKNQHKDLVIGLKYTADGKAVIQGIQRISKPGLRIYSRRNNIPYIMSGLGIAVLSTSKGVLTDNDARRSGLGGELICRIW